METTKENNIYFLKEAPIRKAIAHLGLPMMIGLSVSSLYNLINAFFIGLVHDTAMLSAITIGSPILIILMAIGDLFGVGGSSYISRLLGTGETKKGRQVAGYAFYAAIALGIVVALLAALFLNPLVHLLGADAATLLYTKQYAMILLGGGFALILNFTLEQLVRSEGAAKESMIGVFISVAVSIILDIVLILGLNLHVVGAATSMVLANLASSAYYAWFLENKSATLKGFMKHAKLAWHDQAEIYKIGVSELFKSGFMIVTSLLLNNFAIQYGDNVAAAMGIGVRIAQLPEFMTMGLFLGAMPLFAYSFAGQNVTRLQGAIKELMRWIGGISLVFALTVYVFRVPVMHLFSSDHQVIEIGLVILTAQLVSMVFNGFTGLFTGIFQASGQGAPTMILSIIQGILFIPILLIMHGIFGVDGLIWSVTITEGIAFLTGVVLLVPYLKKLQQGNLGSVPNAERSK